jgi:hypothetical protein
MPCLRDICASAEQLTLIRIRAINGHVIMAFWAAPATMFMTELSQCDR